VGLVLRVELVFRARATARARARTRAKARARAKVRAGARAKVRAGARAKVRAGARAKVRLSPVDAAQVTEARRLARRCPEANAGLALHAEQS
jgi:hypothetical protein